MSNNDDMFKGQFSGLVKQAQEMQDALRKIQEELEHVFVDAQAGAGLIKIKMSCKHVVKSIHIDPSLKKDPDFNSLPELITAALADAAGKIEKIIQERMTEVTQSLNLPPDFRLPPL